MLSTNVPTQIRTIIDTQMNEPHVNINNRLNLSLNRYLNSGIAQCKTQIIDKNVFLQFIREYKCCLVRN